MTALEARGRVPTWETVMERLLHEETKRTVKADTDAAFLSNKTRREKKTSVMNEANLEFLFKIVFIEKWKKSNSSEKCSIVRSVGDEKVTF